MRAPLCFALCLSSVLAACADPAETDAGATDLGFPAADTGVARDSGVRADSGLTADVGFDADGGLVTDGGPLADTGLPSDGGADGGLGDALPGDVDPGLDAAPGDGGVVSGPVTVIFDTPPGFPIPIPGTALFHDPSGALIASVTSTTGVIVQDVPAGSMLTVTFSIMTGLPPPAYDLSTFVGIQPGDTFHVDVLQRGTPIIGDFGLSGGAPYPGAAYYSYDYGCETFTVGDPTQVLVLGIELGCSGSSTTSIDLMVVAYDANAQPLAYRFQEQIPFVPNGSVTLVDPWQTTFQDLDVTVSNAQSGATATFVQLGLTSRGAYFDQSVGEFIDLSSSTGGMLTVTRPVFGDGMSYRLNQVGADWVSSLLGTTSAATALNVDLSSEFLPPPGFPVITVSTAAPDRASFSWPATSNLDFMALNVAIDDPAVSWTIVLPDNATSVNLPELPDELAFLRPTATSVFTAQRMVVDVSSIQGFAGIRALAQASYSSWNAAVLSRQVPAGTTVRAAISGLQ